MSSQLKTDLGESLLDAEMNVVYWSDEAQRYSNNERTLIVAVAVLSSSSALALFASYAVLGNL